MFDSLFKLIREHYQNEGFIPLHAPCVGRLEKDLLSQCIDSTFVSSVGQYVDQFEEDFCKFTGAKYAVAVVNGTMGLYLGLRLANIQPDDIVLTQSLTFVATANAIKMHHANPLFLDVDKSSYGLSASQLEDFLKDKTEVKNQTCILKETGQVIRACMPMHTLGYPCEIDKIVRLCKENYIFVIEDAAESLGSYYHEQHTGTFGDIGVFSFNGNKILTTGGGGMLVTNDERLAKLAKHLNTTAKKPHPWLFEHDQQAYNLRMPNINAALGVAQLYQLPDFLREKSDLAEKYLRFSKKNSDIEFLSSISQTSPNYWLNGFICKDKALRDRLLEESNNLGIQTRPLWTPMHQLDIYKDCLHTSLKNTEWLADRIVNIPSGVRCDV